MPQGNAWPAPEPLISLSGIVKEYGDTKALDGVDLTVPESSIVGLVGPSGCGKTTLVTMVTGIEAPTDGRVSVFGKDPTCFTPTDRARLGYMPQQPVLFPQLSVWSNLNFVCSVYGLRMRGRRQRLMELLDLVGMSEHRRKRLVDCSGGMQRRVSLAATLVHAPDLLILDEPTAGIDPLLRERFWAYFRDLRDDGRTLLVPTQYVGEAVSCDLVAVMASGRIITVRPPGELESFAFGGRPLEVGVEGGWVSSDQLERFVLLPGVNAVTRRGDAFVLGVDDIEDARGRVQDLCESVGIRTSSVEAADLTFDDIFVAIVERHTTAAEREAA